jgi:hypothetical protein
VNPFTTEPLIERSQKGPAMITLPIRDRTNFIGVDLGQRPATPLSSSRTLRRTLGPHSSPPSPTPQAPLHRPPSRAHPPRDPLPRRSRPPEPLGTPHPSSGRHRRRHPDHRPDAHRRHRMPDPPDRDHLRPSRSTESSVPRPALPTKMQAMAQRGELKVAAGCRDGAASWPT